MMRPHQSGVFATSILLVLAALVTPSSGFRTVSGIDSGFPPDSLYFPAFVYVVLGLSATLIRFVVSVSLT